MADTSSRWCFQIEKIAVKSYCYWGKCHMSVATANLVGITGITRRLVIDGVLAEADARRALDEATKARRI